MRHDFQALRCMSNMAFHRDVKVRHDFFLFSSIQDKKATDFPVNMAAKGLLYRNS